jgi:hypothetical protein
MRSLDLLFELESVLMENGERVDSSMGQALLAGALGTR